jgi:hypothetical protein
MGTVDRLAAAKKQSPLSTLRTSGRVTSRRFARGTAGANFETGFIGESKWRRRSQKSSLQLYGDYRFPKKGYPFEYLSHK